MLNREPDYGNQIECFRSRLPTMCGCFAEPPPQRIQPWSDEKPKKILNDSYCLSTRMLKSRQVDGTHFPAKFPGTRNLKSFHNEEQEILGSSRGEAGIDSKNLSVIEIARARSSCFESEQNSYRRDAMNCCECGMNCWLKLSSSVLCVFVSEISTRVPCLR